MRSRQQIKEYLMIPDYIDNEYDFITPAMDIEEKYEKEIAEGTVGYGLYTDFVNSPYTLEDENAKNMKQIEEIGGIVVYSVSSVKYGCMSA